jgi:hypothetical protein
MARKSLLIILTFVFSLGSAKLSLAFIFCDEKPTCCPAAAKMPCSRARQILPSVKYSVSCGYHKSCSCEFKKETPSDSCDLAQQHRQLAKTWKKLKLVSSPSPKVLTIDKIKAEEKNPSPPNLYANLSAQDSPLRC